MRDAAVEQNYPLVINARIDVFLPGVISGSDQPQIELVAEAVRRAVAYVDAGADCVFPIALWQRDALAAFLAEAPGPVNATRIPRPGTLSIAELAELGVARVSHAFVLYRAAMEHLSKTLASLT